MDSNKRSQKVTDNNAISQNPNVDLQKELEAITHNNVTTLNLNVDLHPVSYSTESYRSSVRRTLRFKSDSPTDAKFYVSVS